MKKGADSMNTKKKQNVAYLIIKRLFDIVVGIIGVIMMVPIAIIVKIVYVCSGDFNSIFYRQKRIGKNGKEFGLYKFRSMIPNAEEVLKELLKNPKIKEEWVKYQKIYKDPRITSVGKILRRTSLDEIPQFLNILLGDMSMIGPRPLVPGELEEHDGKPEIYQKMRPGLTGWWASSGKSNAIYSERLKLEYYYINHAGLLLDIKCIFKTISAVIFGHGADE